MSLGSQILLSIFVEGWTSALDKQEVAADLVLQNE